MGFIETHMRKSQRHFNGTSLKHFTIEDVGNVFWSQKHFFEMFLGRFFKTYLRCFQMSLRYSVETSQICFKETSQKHFDEMFLQPKNVPHALCSETSLKHFKSCRSTGMKCFWDISCRVGRLRLFSSSENATLLSYTAKTALR